MTWLEHLRQPDRYGIVLLLIVIAMFAIAIFDEGLVGKAISIVILGATLLFALRTSRASRRIRRVAWICVPTLLIVSFIVAADDSEIGREALSVIVGIVVLAVLVAIVARISVHLTVSGSTLLAGLCIYLLIGLFYATVYGFIDVSSSGRLFVQTSTPSATDTLYFSFITMTTVGYGDLTPAENVTKILAATEALSGQIYLVTAVALLVGNLGRTRRRLTERRDDEADRSTE